MVEKVLLTVKGEAQLRERLKHLKKVERPRNIQEIEVARAHGDLSENAEYHAAKEKQGMLDAQIRDVEAKLGTAQIIDPSKFSGNRVLFGSRVLLNDLDTDEEITYQIVGVDEADPKEGRISYTSPLGRALTGKLVDDFVDVKTPGGMREFEILDVQFK
jgi:transcription elongation factor GreA